MMHTRGYNRLRNELIKMDVFLVECRERGQQKLDGDDLVLLSRRTFSENAILPRSMLDI